MRKADYPAQTEQWDVFEYRTEGISSGNPFVERTIRGSFRSGTREVKVDGFYDGDGIYLVRYMPDEPGEVSFTIDGNYDGDRTEAFTGSFSVTKATEGNHGPVRVQDRTRLFYTDGTPHLSFGTTCYAWVHQSTALQEETLASLTASPFNKIRFCIFPKHYDYNYNEPLTYPFEGTPGDTGGLDRSSMQRFTEEKPGNHWDFTRFRPEHFRRFDERIRDLMKHGIEADLILFHPYDRWGFDGMGAEADDRYVRYCIARFAAFRNVWWSLANEYDFIRSKKAEDWERIGRLVTACDPYGHLCSVHNGPTFYDFSRDWVTHCSCQGTSRYRSTEQSAEFLDRYQKPVVWDEVLYEGNIDLGWGNITGEEMTRRFWEGMLRGAHVGHGETLLDAVDEQVDDAILWWSHGGRLKGESPERIAFLKKILKDVPGGPLLNQDPACWDAVCGIPANAPAGSYYLYYFSFLRPLFRDFHFPEDTVYRVDLIDTWNMTVTPLGEMSGNFRVVTGGKPWMALRLIRV